jgi:PAS domain S-box-containing protein
MSDQSDDALNYFASVDQDASLDSDKTKSAPETDRNPDQRNSNSVPYDGAKPHEKSINAHPPPADKYSLLYDYAPNGYLTIDDSAVIWEANLTLANWLEIDKKALKGVSLYQFLDLPFHASFASHLKTMLSGSPRHNCTLCLKSQNKRSIPVNFESVALRDFRGRLSQIFCTITDITALQKQIEADQIQKTMVEAAGQALLSTDKNLRITQWNQAAQELFGWSADEILGLKSTPRIRTQILEPLINQEMMRRLELKGTWSGLVTTRRKDNSKFTTRAAVGVIWDTLGSFNGLVAVLDRPDSPLYGHEIQNDTTALEQLVRERTDELTRTNNQLRQEINRQKLAALASRDSEGKNRDLVDNIKLGIFRCTPGLKGRFLDVNKAMETISGYNREQLLQIHVSDLFSGGSDTNSFINDININDWKLTRELKLKKKNGQTVSVAVTVVAIRFESGATQFCDGIIEDISDRKLAEVQIKQSLERLQKTIKEIIEAMAYIGEVRDPYTAGHQRRVAQLSQAIGRLMGLGPDQYEGLSMAAFVHDIGKILVPADILSKPGKLTKPEVDMLRDHTRVGYEILKTIEFPWPIASIVLQHHERIDGSGYPFGIAGENIILEARILAVADVVEAMSSHRPYRPALGIDKALEEIVQNRGTLYDSKVVDSCLKLFKETDFVIDADFSSKSI